MAEVNIKCLPNGPLLVTGDVDLTDDEGKKLATGDGGNVALCRCGASKNKPLCDGAHKAAGFKSGE
jgi:CDGSH-type Zn-finger protein